MKFTYSLNKQHIGKALRYLWQHQRARPVSVTKVEGFLKSMKFSIQDAKEVTLGQHQNSILESEKIVKSTICNSDNDNWNNKNCYIFGDQDVLQDGVLQACLLTKTQKFDNDLPKQVQNIITNIPNNINNLIKRIVYTSVIYDTQQVKLPRLKDPTRPAWRFPRVYGISTKRKVYNLSKKFLQVCESLNGLNDTQCKSVLQGGLSSVCVDKEGDIIQFSLNMDIMMMSLVPLTPIAEVNMEYGYNMGTLYPLHHTIGLTKHNIYKHEDVYPVTKESPFRNVHTIVIHYDPEEVKNVTQLPVVENQIHARSMLKSFAVAAICARQRFGSDIRELPEPIVVQCIQSDGQNFHFSIYQLNTLNIDGTNGIKNFWWSKPSMKLYDEAQYTNGQPCLKGYNSEVFKNYLAFYKNV